LKPSAPEAVALAAGAAIAAPAARLAALKARVVQASGWTLAGFALGQALRFAGNLVMTRLLVPEMFGVMALATMVMYGLALFSDVGLRQAIVQSRHGREAAFLNTAWTIQIVRGLVMWAGALLVSAGLLLINSIVPADSAYADPRLPWVVAFLSLAAVISGFESTKLAEASRTLSLARVTQLEAASQAAGLACMIGWAAAAPSVWALVAGGLCAAAVRALLSHAWLPGSANRWQWDRTAWREILGFGKWIIAASVLGFFVNSADRLILGALLTSGVLGVYAIAHLLFSTGEQVLVKIIADVSHPALSELARERPGELRSAYYKFHLGVGVPACAAAGLLMVSGEPLVALLYDARYAQAGWMLEVLAVALVTIPFRVATQCFMVLGAPQALSRTAAIRLVALCVLTPAGWHFFGLGGALWAIVLSHFSWLPSAIAFAVRRGLFDARKELLLAPALLLGAAAGMVLNHAL